VKNSSGKRRKNKILRNPVRNGFLGPKKKILKTGITNLAKEQYVMMTLMRTVIALLLLLAKDDVLSAAATSRAVNFQTCLSSLIGVNLEEDMSTGMACSFLAFSVNLKKLATIRQYNKRDVRIAG
jgi:hypothetical protein